MPSAVNLEGVALHGHMKGVTMLKFNRDGDLLFSSSKDTNCTACCWYTKTGKLLGSYTTVGQVEGRGHDSAMVALDVNSESTLLATASLGEEVLLWSVETGALLGSISRSMSSGVSVGFSHDDTKLMVATKGRAGTRSAIHVYNVPFVVPKDGEDIAPTKAPFTTFSTFETTDIITWAAWGPTDRTIYYSESGFMHILDVETSQVIRSREIHSDGGVINRFSWDPNYLTLATASTDNTSHLVDYRDFSEIQVYESDVPVNDVSISPNADHIILGGGMDAAAVTTQGGQSIFEVKIFHKVHGHQLGQLRCHFGTITAMSFHPDGRGFASGSYDGLIKLYRFGDSYESAPGGKPLWTPRN
ncbi:putative eukaryotic translation initiation factor 3 subunit 2 [Leptomonas seymouri]|uniref:Eukaryotic translation initiation factor 3 subunit I n=1 Tax=Leptomonas seymouri TaxID=5684 RepID=A0A0N0P675_LEPSE|nr:putative eukaryotic translation initiation factor 3 subunit 2 [Leptomonas seymouri]|eukprot:KPI87299.1 putative eukaryotic translation initiation factor 3 subunit 2 [Leptomonas seymouri]